MRGDLRGLPALEWFVDRNTLVGGAAGSIRQRVFIGEDGVQWAVSKARSSAKHSNGVEWLIFRNGELIDYARKLRGAMAIAESYARGEKVPDV